MSTDAWITGYVVETLFLLWLLLWGGARFLEGSFASGCLISWWTPGWDDEQIRFYALLALIVSTAWFIGGLFRPALRLF